MYMQTNIVVDNWYTKNQCVVDNRYPWSIIHILHALGLSHSAYKQSI